MGAAPGWALLLAAWGLSVIASIAGSTRRDAAAAQAGIWTALHAMSQPKAPLIVDQR